MVRIEAARLVGWDSLLVTVLWQLRARLLADGGTLDDSGLPSSARRLLALAVNEAVVPPLPGRRSNPLAAIGNATIAGLAAIGAVTELLGGLLGGLANSLLPRSRRNQGGRMQAADLLDAVQRAGPSALPIVGLVNLLMGAILAFIGAAQLRRFGAQIFVSELVGLSLVRELAPVMTAIVLAGRTGGANAARLATMQGNEEIDALQVLGISERSFLVLPMTLSLVLTMPLLYFYACLIGMTGGALVAVIMLDLSPLAFASALVHVVPLSQFAFGAVKSMAFALLIGLVSCHVGLRAGRSAAAVGAAATRAVVVGIVGVIALDALFAVLADAIGL
jgi:phospholipid/cholesterol/gamma-HCH transport system permease protein